MKLYHSVDEITESSEPLNDSQRATLSTSLEKLTRKRDILRELDEKISVLIVEPEELEKDVYEADEIQDTIIERLD